MANKEEEVIEPEPEPEPPAPQLEVTWINELRQALTEIRSDLKALVAKPPEPAKKESPEPAPQPQASSLEAKLDQLIARLEPKKTESSPASRQPFLTRRKR